MPVRMKLSEVALPLEAISKAVLQEMPNLHGIQTSYGVL
jgi:hypothetical protein